MKKRRFIASAAVALILMMASVASAAPGVVAVYSETDLGGGNWQYDYTFYNSSTEGEALHEVYFYFTGDVPLSGISLPAGWYGLPWTGTYTISYLNAYSSEFPYDVDAQSALGGFSFTAGYMAGEISYTAYFSGDKQISGMTVGCETLTFYGDADGDGYGDPAYSAPACSAPAGYVPNDADCDDTDPAILDETQWHPDIDEDGYGNPAVTVSACFAPAGYIEDDTDCNDSDPIINPETQWHPDADGDGYGSFTAYVQQCAAPAGYILDFMDCDDSDPAIHPYTLWHPDADGDGYGSMVINVQQCTAPAGHVLDNSDCDDSNASLNLQTIWYQDSDGDGFGTSMINMQQCTEPGGPIDYVLNNMDYDDNDPSIDRPVRIDGETPSYYMSPQEAYDAAADGDTIQCVAVSFTGNLTIDLDKSVTMVGGYDGSYSAVTDLTVLQGNMIVTGGALNIENIELLQ